MLSIVRSIKCGQVTRGGPAHKRCRFQDWFRGVCAEDDHDVCSGTIEPPEKTSKATRRLSGFTVRNSPDEQAPGGRHEAPRRGRSSSRQHWRRRGSSLTLGRSGRTFAGAVR